MESEKERRTLRALWHVLMAGAALYELRSASSAFRRLLLGAAAGWHLVAAVDDWREAP